MKKLLFSALLAMLCAGAVWAGNSRDVNGDGEVNIGDVNAVIDAILSGHTVALADVNGDGEVNIADVNAVIDCILGGGEPQPDVSGEAFTVNGVTFKMMPVEGGTFTMGATEQQGSDAQSSEKPAHEVTVSSYSIGQTEVTQALWQAVMGESQSDICSRLGKSTYGIGDDNPVYYVSWEECQLFIAELNRLTGKNFRLPTEAEWEFAARGGNKSQHYKYSGSNDIDKVAWHIGSSGSHPVASLAPNELGLYDMSGNVYEWCQDWFGSYSSSAQTDPTGPGSGSSRVGRGGGWDVDARYCRVSCRSLAAPSGRGGSLGLRLVLDDKEVFTVNGVSFTMMPVEGGTFTMGGTEEQGSDASSSGKPVHQVTLSSYSIGQTEVTQELWLAVMGSNPSNFTGNLQRPVEMVSWDDCQEFIAKLNELTGKTFRLPTEAEWEFAARGGNLSRHYKYAGSNNLDEVAWYNNNGQAESTQPVAAKKANELGLYDMSGNVTEWCQDWYDGYSSEAQTNPTGPDSGPGRVNRGGNWFYNAGYCRVSDRRAIEQSTRRIFLGLRLVLDDKEVFTVNGVTFKMMPVEGGTFTMGGTEEQGSEAQSSEKPAHEVTLSSYSIGQTEVTQELWVAVMGNNPSIFNDNLQRPVEQVSWNDCQEFIAELNRLTGKHFRLPSEAEWEFAARGGNSSKHYKYSGSNNVDEVAWYSGNRPTYGTQPVATKKANELGLYDMSGNVYEWCQDWYGSYSSASQTNPTGPSSGSYRVLRGGCWNDDARICRVSYRYGGDPAYRGSHNGLRLAL